MKMTQHRRQATDDDASSDLREKVPMNLHIHQSFEDGEEIRGLIAQETRQLSGR
jgi:hypothetical protein